LEPRTAKSAGVQTDENERSSRLVSYSEVPMTEAASAVPGDTVEAITVKSEKRVRLADRVGIFLSGLCVVHCLLTPFVILLIPSLEASGYHDLFHDALLVILPLVAVSAFIPGFRRHRNKSVFYWSAPGLAMIAIGALVFHEQVWGQVIFSVAGSLFLIRAHVVNRRLCACCSEEGHSHSLLRVHKH
jgi:hypothetical protein